MALKGGEATGRRPGGGGAAGAGRPRGRARGPCRSIKKAEKLKNMLFLYISRKIDSRQAVYFKVDSL